MGKELVVVYLKQHAPYMLKNSAQTPGKRQSEELMFHSDTSQVQRMGANLNLQSYRKLLFYSGWSTFHHPALFTHNEHR